ncbi:Hypothetical protein ORPV_22 [Orpheovirus IHUMI-LCC2]|uniref:Uncharacterized protein n=1 Tax=Orpheovirus IHUMI-LCC2 TaxID=2023057 RepID=A0A2I2L324_9VIRU|nr:Hypothetical protein ORPV_22 [Orpheovirus IHUMI-LCC2]SNW61926.1 Hypothetical protein ORPV_22 [Orpheovirus IHUMI-LCC2]
MDSLDLSEILTLYHDNKLHDSNLVDKYIQLTISEPYYEKNTVYHIDIFKSNILNCKYVGHLDDINSTVCRCVEYGLYDQLQFLLDNLDLLVSKATYLDGIKSLCKLLMLRKIDMKCYLMAKEYGFTDVNLERRISYVQELIKGKDNRKLLEYEGPKPEEYGELRYWGYRHTLYYLKYNKKDTLSIVKRLVDEWWGDCRYSAYVDRYGEHDGNAIDHIFKHRDQ